MVDQLNYEGIEFPVATKHYCKIEGQNNININVFGYENKQFYPIYVSKQYNENVLNLLLITEDEKQHYVLIKDFNSLMYNKTKHRERKQFCMHCLQCFSTEEILSKHETNCIILNGEQAIRMPQKGNNVLSFRTIISRCQCLLQYTQILRPLLKRYRDANQAVRNHILINIKSIRHVVMVIKYSAVTMINIQNQCRFIGERIPLKGLCKRCLKRYNIVKRPLLPNSRNH